MRNGFLAAAIILDKACYEFGEGVEQSDAEAAKWYRKAAEQGYAEAQLHLGNCSRNGQGLPQNYENAAKWYRMAAEQGHVKAQFHLALCYKYGEGVEQSNAEAVKWCRRIAEQGGLASRNSRWTRSNENGKILGDG